MGINHYLFTVDMKINRLDAHDRLISFTKENFSINECCQNLINQKPFGDYPFYIFVHPRTDEDGVTKRLIWQPRLTKPRAQTNSMLFKAYPGTDIVKVIWMIPARELWETYEKGKMTENKLISESIDGFVNRRNELEAREDDDLPDWLIDDLYAEIARRAKNERETRGFRMDSSKS